MGGSSNEKSMTSARFFVFTSLKLVQDMEKIPGYVLSPESRFHYIYVYEVMGILL